jgi:hypothetical protein
VGRPPTPDVLKSQPRWTWFMSWGDPEGMWMRRQAFQDLYTSEAVLTLDELAWVTVKVPRVHYPVIK